MLKFKYLLRSLLITSFLWISFSSCDSPSPFVSVNDEGQFVLNGQPHYFIGTNFWYGAFLGADNESGDRERLEKELDFLKAMGVTNLRVLVGSDGKAGVPTKVEPTLQQAPGVYDETMFRGLDYLMMKLSEKGMKAVLYMNNSWEWSGGYTQYLEWAGYGKAPVPAVDGWDAYFRFVIQFPQSDSAKALFRQYVHDVVTRTNYYTGVPYTEDPAIFSWQVGNEPRAFNDENKPFFTAWLKETAAYIKSLDPNHMVSTGSEGKNGSEFDMQMYEEIHADDNFDYLNFHIWPLNWTWISDSTVNSAVEYAKSQTLAYVNEHLAVADRLNKPVVFEEFGFPRDGYRFELGTPTTARDNYYGMLFDLLVEAAENGGRLAGCNFWGWGGYARPVHTFWQPGDPYCGDPAQEAQGLNSVFVDDSTVELIRLSNEKIKNLLQ